MLESNDYIICTKLKIVMKIPTYLDSRTDWLFITISDNDFIYKKGVMHINNPSWNEQHIKIGLLNMIFDSNPYAILCQNIKLKTSSNEVGIFFL